MATRAGHSARRYVPVSRHYPDLLARGPPPVQMAPLRVVRRRNIALGNCEACLRTRARDGINIIEGWSYAGRQGPAAAVVGHGEPGIVDRATGFSVVPVRRFGESHTTTASPKPGATNTAARTSPQTNFQPEDLTGLDVSATKVGDSK